MNEGAQRHYGITPGVSDGVGAFFRLFASLLFLAWVLPSATHGQHVSGHSTGQSSFAASQPIEHSTIVVRDLARHAGVETSRFKTGASVPLVEGNGKTLGVVPIVRLPLEYASGIAYAFWPDDHSKQLTVRAFDARGPPDRAA